MASARKSLPTPDSPSNRMLTSWSRIFSTVCRSVRIDSFFVRTKSFSDGSGGFFAAGIPRRYCLSGEFWRDIRRVAPQPFQAVEAPAILGKDVENEIAEVDQDPAAGDRPLDEEWLHAFVLSYLFQDSVGDRLRLSFGVCRTEHEVIGNRGELADCEHVEVERLLVERCGHRGAHAMLDGIGHVASLYKP